MRHGKKINHLGKTAPHRKAMLSNMASSLIINKRITTTVAKAKELRRFVEPLITKAKDDTTHSRRVIFSYLKNKESVKALFNEVAEKVAERPGGYTRIIKTGNRLGDSAQMCMIELVDFNEYLLGEIETKKTKTRRRRRGGKSQKAEAAKSEQETTVEEATESQVSEKEEAEKTKSEIETPVEPPGDEIEGKDVEEKVKEEKEREAVEPEAETEEHVESKMEETETDEEEKKNDKTD